MLEAFKSFTAQQHLLPEGGKVLLAISGGRDSVCLLDLALRAGWNVAVAHCNFKLRGEESDRDEAFVRHLVEGHELTLHVVSFDTKEYALRTKKSIEEAARELRYNWFSDLCRQHGYSVIATAHHRDDSIETFFLNLFRGTGIAGLHGIRPSSSGVIRPLLCFSRQDIDSYVSLRELPFVEDSTNALLDARRNRIRHELMPLLRNLYPSVDSTMAANIERLHDAELVYSESVEYYRQKLIQPYSSRFPWVAVSMSLIDLPTILSKGFASTLLFEILHPYGFSGDSVRAILQAKQSGTLFSSEHYDATLWRGKLLIKPHVDVSAPSFEVQEVPYIQDPSPYRIFVDADEVTFPLTVRRWITADRISPLGMHGKSRLVSDILKDCHISRLEKPHAYLLCDASGKPLWLIGLSTDHRFRVRENTKRILSISIVSHP